MISAFTDGSGTVPTEPACIGVVVMVDGESIVEVSEHLGNGSNNFAEVRAIRRALWLLEELFGADVEATIYSDSTYAIWAATSEELPGANARLVWELRKQSKAMPGVKLEHVYGHCGVHGNELADFLAGDARARLMVSRGKVVRRKRRPEPGGKKRQRVGAAIETIEEKHAINGARMKT